jgi:DNA-binding NtrC family response regulator
MKNRILVVDDEESIRWVLSTSLEKQGYEVDLGVNGTEALEKAFSNNYSLIILDINMPDISGLTVLKELKEKDYKRPVVLITAQNTVNNAITGIKLGAYDYIAKPFDLDEVNRLVAKIITNFKQSEKPKLQKAGSISA